MASDPHRRSPLRAAATLLARRQDQAPAHLAVLDAELSEGPADRLDGHVGMDDGAAFAPTRVIWLRRWIATCVESR